MELLEKRWRDAETATNRAFIEQFRQSFFKFHPSGFLLKQWQDIEKQLYEYTKDIHVDRHPIDRILRLSPLYDLVVADKGDKAEYLFPNAEVRARYIASLPPGEELDAYLHDPLYRDTWLIYVSQEMKLK